MNSNSRRDELKINRLSSFLYQEGKVNVANIVPIKANVFLVKTSDGNKVILKKHRKKEDVDQQWDFFDKLSTSIVIPFRRFPNGKKILISNGYYWTIAPFIEGTKLNYAINDDRKACLATLRAFHERAEDIRVTNPLRRKLFYKRWYKRLQSFKNTRDYFLNYGFENLFKDIVQTTETQLRLVSELPWERLERKAEEKRVWIHGDVASHNFIRSRDVYMIDFDLLGQSPQIYDYIQLAQRFLPYLDWNLDKLISYRMVEDSQLKFWILAMTVPSDVLREWLHFLSRNSTMSMEEYLTNMENEWIKRQEFLKNAKAMLKLY
ncbi:phosphotransferase [Virgibacillus ndiopensis]|uniref:phosphotransferase n=1 Tax=Virgibacillus ndiopensis TaxID=2004408 RepID=UPI00159BB5AC|nr:phosphotransferase [Virgibacillus ndiopensis]